MTNRDLSREFDPKHRIIGAVIVVALAVILLPLILSQRGTPADIGSPRIGIAAADGNKVAITQVTPSRSAEPVKPKVAPAPIAAPAPAAPPPPATVSAKAASVPAKPPTADNSKPANIAVGWVVQVGTFANTANANRLEQKLRAEGQPVRVEQIKIDTGKAVRLRVGPFDDRTAALKAQERIQRDVGIKGVVLAYP